MEDKKYTIIPCKCGGGYQTDIAEDRLIRSSFSYLHGSLETLAGYDVYMFVDEAPIVEGIYPVVVILSGEKIESTAFLWEDKTRTKGLQGLVVANTDLEYYEDAKDKFDRKQYFI